jgi:hypothetical protein
MSKVALKKVTTYYIHRIGFNDINGFKTSLAAGYYAQKNNIIDYKVGVLIEMSR